MKNIHIIPTDKPSNLLLCLKNYVEHENTPAENFDIKGKFTLGYGKYANGEFYQQHHMYIINDEEIKEGNWCLHFGISYIDKVIGKQTTLVKITDKQLCGKNGGHRYFWKQWDKNPQFSYHHDGLKKIIATTDQYLIKDGVQAINNVFLEWFVQNPSCEKVELLRCPIEGLYTIIPKEEKKQIKCYCGHTTYCDCIPLEEPKQELERGITITHVKNKETLEEIAKSNALYELFNNDQSAKENFKLACKRSFLKGVKWQQERSYSKQELFNIINLFDQFLLNNRNMQGLTREVSILEWFEQFKKK